MCNKEQCKYYQHPKICVNKSYCNSQSSNICNSIKNYCIGLEQQCKSLQEQIDSTHEYYKELRINATELADKVIQNQNNINFWKHQAELGRETTDRLSKQLEEKEQECQKLKEEIWSLSNKSKEIQYQDLCFSCKHKNTLDEKGLVLQQIFSIVKDWYENEWSCYKCRINMDNKLKQIMTLVKNLANKG